MAVRADLVTYALLLTGLNVQWRRLATLMNRTQPSGAACAGAHSTTARDSAAGGDTQRLVERDGRRRLR